MNDRLYEVSIEKGMTCFILPLRIRSAKQKIVGASLIGLGLGLSMVGIITLRQLPQFVWRLPMHGGIWVIVAGVVACAAPLKFGRDLMYGGHGEVRASVEGDVLRVMHRVGKKEEWEVLPLTRIERLEVTDMGGRFRPEENAWLTGQHMDGTRVRIALDYPRWLLEALAVHLRTMIQEAKEQAGDGQT